MPHPFLSDEWIEAAEAIRARHTAERGTPPVKVRMNVIVNEMPFGDSTMRGYIDTSDGVLMLARGRLDAPDVTVTTDYQTAKALFVEQDVQVAMQAFMGGKIKVQGDLTKLMALQAGPLDDTARQISAEIKAITE